MHIGAADVIMSIMLHTAACVGFTYIVQILIQVDPQGPPDRTSCLNTGSHIIPLSGSLIGEATDFLHQ